MREALQRAWLRRGLLACLLWPLSLLYGFVAGLRRGLYRSGLLRTERVAVPVVVVGNLVAGGAGKTPVVMALAGHLRARGLRPGIVSRGHARAGDGCREVLPGSLPVDSGDEPLLIARRTGLPVFVARRRADAARALLAGYPGTGVIVSDDGLQHYALGREVEVCVFDRRLGGNGFLLPAGPLREPMTRPVDLRLCDSTAPLAGAYPVLRELAPHALRADGSSIALAQLQGRPLHAVAGIAQPEAFFDMLRGQGLTLAVTSALPDHHDFADWQPVPAGRVVVCTEKDAAKLWQRQPDALAIALQVTLPPAFLAAFDRLLDAKLSSRHGPETA